MKNWEADGTRVVIPSENRFVYQDVIVLQADSEDSARLAAAAPDMARVLLEVEWGGVHDVAICPTCARWSKDGHALGCSLDAALRKAGVR